MATNCPHGYDGEQAVSVDEDERSSCCGAFVTFTGDGDLVCKCCYGLVDGGEVIEGFEVRL